jgi:hypothetical protein
MADVDALKGEPVSPFTSLPPSSSPLRVRWVEYPFHRETGCEMLPGRHRYLHWEGVSDAERGPVWSDRSGFASLPESSMAKQGWLREGVVLAFAGENLLVAATDGRIVNLPLYAVRRIE